MRENSSRSHMTGRRFKREKIYQRLKVAKSHPKIYQNHPILSQTSGAGMFLRKWPKKWKKCYTSLKTYGSYHCWYWCSWSSCKIHVKKLNRQMLERPNVCYIFKSWGFKDVKYEIPMCQSHSTCPQPIPLVPTMQKKLFTSSFQPKFLKIRFTKVDRKFSISEIRTWNQNWKIIVVYFLQLFT